MDRGYSTHGRYFGNDDLEREDAPVLQRIKKVYWTKKQQLFETIGKKEDVHIVASDAQLDAKLEAFKEIESSCDQLLNVIAAYQKRICVLAKEEHMMGKFLKTGGQEDATRAGKMMVAVGKSQAFSAQQRVQLRNPLFRLYQEVFTFRKRAVTDTTITVQKMEEARTEYRGALLWMKDVSEQLDPDTYGRMEKFRKVQIQVKKTKDVFDKLKLAVMQKIDLLIASRCNMYSHALANYQNSMLSFWKKTSKTMYAVLEAFKGFQYYEFDILKRDLDDATKDLARETASDAAAAILMAVLENPEGKPQSEEDRLICEILETIQDKTDTNSTPKEVQDNRQQKQRVQNCESEETSELINLEGENSLEDVPFGDFQTALDESRGDRYEALQQDDDPLAEIFGSDSQLCEEMDSLCPSGPSTGAHGMGTCSYLPSDLLDMPDSSLTALLPDSQMLTEDLFSKKNSQLPRENKSKQAKPSSWYNLFADLDPLGDPDAVGKTDQSHQGGCA